MWFLTLKNVGSTHARVCPGPRWPARCASRKGQMSWLLCSRWTPSGHVMLGAAASSSAEPFWSSLRNKPPRSQLTASLRRLAAAHDLREKNRRHENKLTVWQVNVAFNHNNGSNFKNEGKKNLERLRKTPHWMRRQPPDSLRNIWPTEM